MIFTTITAATKTAVIATEITPCFALRDFKNALILPFSRLGLFVFFSFNSRTSSAPAASFEHARRKEQEQHSHAEEEHHIDNIENTICKVLIIVHKADFLDRRGDPLNLDDRRKIAGHAYDQTRAHADNSGNDHALGERRDKHVYCDKRRAEQQNPQEGAKYHRPVRGGKECDNKRINQKNAAAKQKKIQ